MADAIRTNISPLHRREVFYVGGEYVVDGNGNHTFQDQMYVERLIPEEAGGNTSKPFPLVFIHGKTRSGADWLTKPDGQPGWASYFLSQGFECYLVDLPNCGRSPWNPSSGRMISYPAESFEAMFTACQDFGTWPQAKLHTQWPGTGKIGDPVFDHFFASSLQIGTNAAAQERAAQTACAALLDRIGKPVVLVGHSAGGAILWLTADIRPDLVAMIVALEPTGPPFYKVGIESGPGAPWGISNAPLTYDPPVTDPETDFVKTVVRAPGPDLIDCTLQAETPAPRKLVNLVDIPVLIVTAPASYHAQYDWGTVRFLRQAGVEVVEHMKLEDEWIRGNAHMMFMERNSDDIAAIVGAWIDG